LEIGAEIIERIKNGDGEAFRIFYREYFPKIYNYAYRRVKVKETAEDLTEETFFKVFKAFRTFQLKEGFTLDMWIYAVERNVVRDWFRKNVGFKILPLEERFDSAFTPLLNDPYSTAENELVGNYVKSSLKEIPERYRRIIELRFFKGKHIKEIALELKKSEGAVKVLQFRALKALKEKIEEKLRNEQ